MKKMFFLSILFLIPSFVSAQAQDLNGYGLAIASQLTIETNGYVDYSNNEEGMRSERIILPKTTSFDDVRSQVNSFVREHSNISIQSVWQEYGETDRSRDEDIDIFVMTIEVGENNEHRFLISYTETIHEKRLFVSWGLWD